MLRRLPPSLAVPLLMVVPLVACGSEDDGLGPGPQGSDQPGATAPTTMAGEMTCERQGLYRITYPEGWQADEECSKFSPPGAASPSGAPTPAISVEATTQTYEDLVSADVGPGATREEVSLGPARAERVTYVAGGAAGTTGGATPVVRYTVDLVPGTGTAATSDEQALVISAVSTGDLAASDLDPVLERMVQSLFITAYRPERGDPEPQ